MSEFNQEALLAQIKGLIAEATKGSVTEKELNDKVSAINEKLEGLNNKENNHTEVKALAESVEKLIEQVNATSLSVKALTENGVSKSEKPKTLKEAMEAAILEKKDGFLKEVNDDYGKRLSMKDYFERGNQKSPVFTVKSAVDMLQSAIAGNYVNYHRLTELDPNRVGIPLTIYPHVMVTMPSKSINKPYMALLVVGTYTDGSGTKTEGSASSKSSFLLTTVNFKAFYIATHFILSDETLDDLEEVMSEINATAPDKILDAIDSKVLSASGDDSSDIAGLFTANKKTDFASTWDGTVPAATIVDLISKMKLQCEGNKYRPDQVWLNPTDIDNITALKNDISDSVNDRRVTWGANGVPVAICGLAVRANTNVTADTCAVVDSKQLMLGVRKDITMEIGYNAADLTEGQKTVVLKCRIAFGVRDKAGVIYSSSIATDVAAILKGA